MAESQKGASSPIKLKEKTSLLDMDFEKDFLSSWKSISVAGDDTMDFDFGTGSKGKKKAFNFDKLDVNFSLDDDLDKISSFKIDMSDLDISSSANKAGKPREKSNEESARGNLQQKQDRFNLTIDFNELDSFCFELSSKKEGKCITENKDGEEASNRSGFQSHQVDMTDAVGASEGSAKLKPASSQATTSLEFETVGADPGEVDCLSKNFPSNPTTNEKGPSKLSTIQHVVTSVEAVALPDKIFTSIERDKDSHHQEEKTTSTEPYAQKTVQDLSIQEKTLSERNAQETAQDLFQSVSGHASTVDTASESLVENCALATKVTSHSSTEQCVEIKSVATVGINSEKSLLHNLSEQQIARSLSKNYQRRSNSDSNVSEGNIEGNGQAQDNSDSEDTSTSVLKETMHSIEASKYNDNANRELHFPLSSGASDVKSIQNKEKENCVIQSKTFKRLEEKESQSGKTTSILGNINIFASKTFCFQKQTGEGRHGSEAKDSQVENKLIRDSTPHSGEVNKSGPIHPGSKTSFKDLRGIGALNVNKLIGSSRLHDQEVKKGEAIQENEKIAKNPIALSSSFNLSSVPEQTNKSPSLGCATLRFPASSIASIEKSNEVYGQGNKSSSHQSEKSLPDLSGLMVSRTLEVNHPPSDSTIKKQLKSSSNTKQSIGLEGSTAPRITYAVSTEKQMMQITSLKRKIYQASNDDILKVNPSKRFSQSPTESRNARELLERVVDKEVCHHETLDDSNSINISKHCQTSKLDLENKTELQMSLVMEKDDNVEKAEAYTKELEDICNKLKKKHEEAKELLVRAIVNNNYLLMLNHPIYEEKICKIQEFAEHLVSRELHT